MGVQTAACSSQLQMFAGLNWDGVVCRGQEGRQRAHSVRHHVEHARRAAVHRQKAAPQGCLRFPGEHLLRVISLSWAASLYTWSIASVCASVLYLAVMHM
jgi:hypothetical protein